MTTLLDVACMPTHPDAVAIEKTEDERIGMKGISRGKRLYMNLCRDLSVSQVLPV